MLKIPFKAMKLGLSMALQIMDAKDHMFHLVNVPLTNLTYFVAVNTPRLILKFNSPDVENSV